MTGKVFALSGADSGEQAHDGAGWLLAYFTSATRGDGHVRYEESEPPTGKQRDRNPDPISDPREGARPRSEVDDGCRRDQLGWGSVRLNKLW